MLSNAYFLAKFRFDTAENEPAKNLQNFRKISKIGPSWTCFQVPSQPGVAAVLLDSAAPPSAGGPGAGPPSPSAGIAKMNSLLRK